MVLPNPGESFSDWQDRKRVLEEQWRRANEALSPPPVKPEIPDWIRARPGDPGIVLGREEPREPLAEGNTSSLNLLITIPGVFAWPLLYPLPVAVSFVVLALVYGVLQYVLGLETRPVGSTLLGAGVGIGGLVLLFKTSRLDHRLARYWPWRWLRHIVRLGLFVVVGHLGIAYRTTGVLGPDPALPERPLHLAGLGVILLFSQLVLGWRWLRMKWDAGLEAIGLRPRGLEAARG
jgi:hypothetical protein